MTFFVMNESTVPYELTFEERKGYLCANAKCDEITLDVELALMMEIADKLNELDIERVMIRRDIPTCLPDGAVFVVVERYVEMVSNITRTGIVNAYPGNTASLAFASLVAENRGAHLRAFDEYPDAEAWLCK